MDKWEACGMEVSARELVVAIEGGPAGRLQRFANTAAGHQALRRWHYRGRKESK